MPDPDLEIMMGEGWGSHLDPLIRGARSPKKCFWPFGSQFRPKIRRGGGGAAGPPRPLPWICHWSRNIASGKKVASHAGLFRGASISSLPVGIYETRAPLKTPAWEARRNGKKKKIIVAYFRVIS